MQALITCDPCDHKLNAHTVYVWIFGLLGGWLLMLAVLVLFKWYRIRRWCAIVFAASVVPLAIGLCLPASNVTEDGATCGSAIHTSMGHGSVNGCASKGALRVREGRWFEVAAVAMAAVALVGSAPGRKQTL